MAYCQDSISRPSGLWTFDATGRRLGRLRQMPRQRTQRSGAWTRGVTLMSESMFSEEDEPQALRETVEHQRQTIHLMAEVLAEIGFDLEDFLVASS
jgi:hypothetical protein